MQELADAPADSSIAELYKGYPIARTAGGLKFINVADDFTIWLSLANAGMLNRGNLLAFDYCLSHLPSNNPIVEIGVFCGLSTNLLNHFKRKHGVNNPLFNCDKWIFEGAVGNVGDSPVSHAEYHEFVRNAYKQSVQTFSKGMLPHTIEAFSDEFFSLWTANAKQTDLFGRTVQLGGPISFCYIDGNHTYEFARRDFENADQFLEPGGFILFDDSADGSKWEVTRVVAEVKRMKNYRVVIQNPNYLVQKIAA
jgi:hypothetical protein